MRILMIVPTLPGVVSMLNFPIGYGYLSAALRAAGHEVYGCNPNNDTRFSSSEEMVRVHVSRALSDYTPELVCIGGLCTDYRFLRDLLTLLRDLAPQTPVVLGGGIVNHDAVFVFWNLRPDFCVIGEAEETLVRLVAALGQKTALADIPNIGYWENHHACFTSQDHHYGEIDARAFPDYSPFGGDEMIERYSSAALYFYRYMRLHPRLVTVVTARGCPFRCTFCIHGHGPRYRARSVDNCLEEIGRLYERTEFNIMMISDELFAANKDRLRQFCERLIEAREHDGWDFDWAFQTHASAALDVATVRLAKQAGCFHFSYGFESASPRVLASMNKRSTPEQVLDGISVADHAQVAFGGNLIFGDPAETLDTIAESLAFLDSHCRDVVINFNLVRPYPGSALFNRCLDTGVIRDKLSYYEVMDQIPLNMTSMSDDVWFGFCQNVLGPLCEFPFVKSTPATAIEPLIDTRRSSNPSLRHQDDCWLIRGECPHCGHSMAFREMIANVGRAGEDSATVLTCCGRCHKRVKVTIGSDIARDVALGTWIERILPATEDVCRMPGCDAIEAGPLTEDEMERFHELWREAETDPIRLSHVLRSAKALEVPSLDKIDRHLRGRLEMEALASSIARSGVRETAVYGSGVNGRALVRALQRKGVRVSLMVDANRAVHGTKVDGLDVVPLGHAVTAGTTTWAVGSSQSAAEIVKAIRVAYPDRTPAVFSPTTRPLDWDRPSDWQDAEVLQAWQFRVRRRFCEALTLRHTWEAIFLALASRRVAFLGANRSVYKV